MKSLILYTLVYFIGLILLYVSQIVEVDWVYIIAILIGVVGLLYGIRSNKK